MTVALGARNISRQQRSLLQDKSSIKVAIVDPENAVVEKVRHKFASQIPNFDAENRIVKLQGDCSEVLPRFLEGELLSTASDRAADPRSGPGIPLEESSR